MQISPHFAAVYCNQKPIGHRGHYFVRGNNVYVLTNHGRRDSKTYDALLQMLTKSSSEEAGEALRRLTDFENAAMERVRKYNGPIKPESNWLLW